MPEAFSKFGRISEGFISINSAVYEDNGWQVLIKAARTMQNRRLILIHDAYASI